MSEQSADPLLDAFLEHTEKHGLLNEEQLQAAIREKPMEEPWLITSNYGRADLTLHPLVREAYKVACLIEMCGASEALTRASCAAFALTESLSDFVRIVRDENAKERGYTSTDSEGPPKLTKADVAAVQTVIDQLWANKRRGA